MKEITLTRNKIAIIDDDDFERVSKYKWYCNNNNMAIHDLSIKGKRSKMILHRYIMNAPKGFEVDHINGNRLDNRKENLRIVTRHQNMLNRKVRADSKTRFKGVEYKLDQLRKKPYNAYIIINGKKKSLGYFETVEVAAKAYDEAALKLHGEFANINFPIEPE